jgi:glycosyltransferase involved in cell wall biosynthesis
MIKAAAQLFSKFGDYRLVIIGDGPERATIEKEIADLGMGGQIHLLGNLSQQEIVKHLNESKLFVMSSLSEGLPKALLEACACGTPAVVTTACNAEGIIEEVGIAVKPGESQALAEAVEAILTDDPQWSRLSENSLRIAERYRWDSISNEVLGLYQRL